MRPFSVQLHRLLWSRSAISLMSAGPGTWLSGQCWVLAEALLRWITLSRSLPPSAVFLAIIADRQCPAHHVVVCVAVGSEAGAKRRWYLDATGVKDEEGLLRYWRDEEGLDEPFLTAFDEQLLLDLGIVRDGRTSTRLAECVLEAFGWFSPIFLDQEEPFNGQDPSVASDGDSWDSDQEREST